MTQEQNDTLCILREKCAIGMSKMEASKFFEKKLGKTNKHIIEYRLSLNDDLIELSKAQIECEKCGALIY